MRNTLTIVIALIVLKAQGEVITNKNSLKNESLVTSELKLPYLDNQLYSELLNKIKIQTRKPAEVNNKTDILDDKMAGDKDFVTLRRELIGDGTPGNKGVLNPNDLDAIITKYSAKYHDISPSAKLAVLQLRALEPFRGFIFRVRSYTGKVSALRTMVVSLLNAQIAGIKMLFPIMNTGINHWEVIFKYLTEPTENLEFEITSDNLLHQAYVEIADKLEKVHLDFGQLVSNDKVDIWWDNKMFMAFSNMTEDRDRFVRLGFVELNAMYSAFSLNLSALFSTISYSFTGLKSVLKHFGQFMGVGINMNDLHLTNDILHSALDFNSLKTEMEEKILTINDFSKMGGDGFSSFVRIGILNSHPDLFVLNQNGHLTMIKAYQYLVESARSANLAFNTSVNTVSNNNDSNSFLFDSRVALVFNRTFGTSLENIITLVTGLKEVSSNVRIHCNKSSKKDESISSVLIGSEKVRLNVKAFYCDPPKSISEFYPQDWETNSKSSKVMAWGENKTLRNYRYGMAKSWKFNPYIKIFPDIANSKEIVRNRQTIKVTDEVAKYNRILLQTWGGVAFAIPMSAIMF